MNYVYTLKRVKENDEVMELLGSRLKEFVSWAAEMMDYYGWLGLEYLVPQFFEDQYDGLRGPRRRMSEKDPAAWKSISKAVFERDNYTCAYCAAVGGKLEADHIVPFSQGGTDGMQNLTTACRRCNRQKKDKSAEEFMEWRKRREG